MGGGRGGGEDQRDCVWLMALSMGICWLWGLVLLIVGVYGGLINENVELQTVGEMEMGALGGWIWILVRVWSVERSFGADNVVCL